MRFHNTFLLIGGAACLLAVGPARAGGLTGPQVLARCQRAYDGLRSYQGLSQVTTNSTFGGGAPHSYHSSARIAFVRPGKIRAAGTNMFGQPYAYVSDGRTTAQRQFGGWSRSQSAEMAIAAMTGTAQSAATTIPALLLHTRWGDPFSRGQAVAPGVGQETVGGHPCYRVRVTGPLPATFWVDRKTFLLDKMATRLSLGTGKGGMQNVQTFSGVRVNAPIPASAFVPPAGR